MSRVRSRGAKDFNSTLTIVDGFKTECRWQYPGYWNLETRTTSMPGAIANKRDNLETMTDVIDNYGRYNPCSQDKSREVFLAVQLASRSVPPKPAGSAGSTSWHVTERNLGFLSGWYSPHYYFATHEWPTFSPPNPNWSQLIGNVGSRLDGSMTSRSLIWEAIWTLGQTIGMIKNPFGLLRANWRQVAKTLSPAGLIKTGANVWLEKRYGWDNLLRDCKNFASVRANVDKHIRFLDKTEGKFTPISEVETLAYQNPTSCPISSLGTPYDSAQIQAFVSEYKRDSRFSLETKRENATRIFSRSDLVNQALGTRKILETLWEIVPMSFIVDWFVDIGGLADIAPISRNSHNLRRIGYSTHSDTKVTVLVLSNAYTWNGFTSSTPFMVESAVVHTLYDRHPEFPSGGTGVGLFGGLSLTHLADSAAIIAQRI